jgi:hypothetical protein
MNRKTSMVGGVIGAGLLAVLGAGEVTPFSASRAAAAPAPSRPNFDDVIPENVRTLLDIGKNAFRFDTFGSERFWGDQLKLHLAIAGQKNGGVGPGVSPNTALSVGLKVDVDALPASLKEQLARGEVDLDDPATTIALLKLNAVVGVTAFVNLDGNIRSMGLNCAFCHSTVTIRLRRESASGSTVGPTAT